MKKEELIGVLKKGGYWEDSFILKYDNPSFWALVEGSVSKEKFDKIKKLFSVNVRDTRTHIRMLENLIKEILKNKKNDY